MKIIKNGYVIDPANNIEGAFDILIEGERIKDIAKPGSFSSVANAETFDAKACWVTPGLIDVHVHLREPGFEWKETIESGSQAAALGGFTTICCMPNTKPVNDNAEITHFIVDKASKVKSGARVLPIGAITKGLEGKEIAPFSEMQKNGAVAFSDDGKCVANAGLMRRALEWTSMLGLPLCCHEEDSNLCHGGCMNESPLSLRLGLGGMPGVAEDVIIARDIELARAFKGRIHFCHVSTARSVELIRRAKNDGIAVTAEVAPHHLVLSEEAVKNYDGNTKMNPPLREDSEISELLRGLADGTLDALACDHAPHEKDSKEVEFDRAAFGIIGIQSSLPLMLRFVREKKLSAKRLIEAYTCSAAKALGIKGSGALAKGAQADICIIDPEKKWVYSLDRIRSISRNSPFIGQEMQGIANTVFRAGKVIVKNEKLEEA